MLERQHTASQLPILDLARANVLEREDDYCMLCRVVGARSRPATATASQASSMGLAKRFIWPFHPERRLAGLYTCAKICNACCPPHDLSLLLLFHLTKSCAAWCVQGQLAIAAPDGAHPSFHPNANNVSKRRGKNNPSATHPYYPHLCLARQASHHPRKGGTFVKSTTGSLPPLPPREIVRDNSG